MQGSVGSAKYKKLVRQAKCGFLITDRGWSFIPAGPRMLLFHVGAWDPPNSEP